MSSLLPQSPLLPMMLSTPIAHTSVCSFEWLSMPAACLGAGLFYSPQKLLHPCLHSHPKGKPNLRPSLLSVNCDLGWTPVYLGPSGADGLLSGFSQAGHTVPWYCRTYTKPLLRMACPSLSLPAGFPAYSELSVCLQGC